MAGRRVAVVVVAWTLAARPAVAEEFHVAPSGDDGAAGDVAAPWATLQHAAVRARPGDTVRVRAGRYAGFDLRAGGTAAAPIRWLAEPGAVIDRANSATPDGINLEGVAWVEVAGFTVRGARRAGIRAVDCAAVTLRGNRVEDAGVWGVFTGFCDDLVIEDNVVETTGAQHCVYVSNSGDRPVLRGNRLARCAQAGIQLNGDASLGGDGVITGAVLEANVVRDAGRRGAAALNLDGAVDAMIHGNLLVDNLAGGIALFRADGGAPSTGARVVHNTIVMAARSRWAVRLRDGATGTTLRNNVLLTRHPARGAVDVDRSSLPGLASDHNAVTPRFTLDGALTVLDLDGWRRRTGLDVHTTATTPEAAFSLDGDHAPAAGGPLVDRGDPTDAPGRDLRGHARLVGAGVDIGAIEACGAAPCVVAPPPSDPPRTGTRASAASRAATPARVRAGCCGGAGEPLGLALAAAALALGHRRRHKTGGDRAARASREVGR